MSRGFQYRRLDIATMVRIGASNPRFLTETLTENDSFNNNINGITISPKKNFCIIKIWISNCDNIDPNIIKNIDGLFPNECFFKKHI